jgi:secreted trypsin-like serine protease
VANPNPAAGRIVAGSEVKPIHSLPYQVMIQPCFEGGCALCGATLINKRYIISAMHCIYSEGETAKSVEAVFGEHNLQEDFETGKPVQTIKVSDIIKRSDYSEQTFDNDIVILKLSQDVELNENVVPACLPSVSSTQYYGQKATVSGWGTTAEGGNTSPFLKKTIVDVVKDNDASCAGYVINSNIKMCGYTQGTDSCQGDSGGPLVATEDGRNTLIGVVSYGQGCARTGVAGVYVKVTGYLDWINKNVADGWCNNAGTVTTTTTAGPTTTTTTAAPGTGCDINCALGALSGNYIINGYPVKCTSGFCTSTDGTDFCAAVGYPCGGEPTTTAAPASGLKCAQPCSLSWALGYYMTEYTSGNSQQFANFTLNSELSIRCDLATGNCCVRDEPDTDLCSIM